MCTYVLSRKKLLFFKVLVQMEMILRLTKDHPVPVKARNSGIERTYVALWDFLIITFLFLQPSRRESLLSAGLASETHRLRKKMRK